MRSQALTRLRKMRISASRDLLSNTVWPDRKPAELRDASSAGKNRLRCHKNRSPWLGAEVLTRRAGRRRRDIGWRRLARDRGVSAALVVCAPGKDRAARDRTTQRLTNPTTKTEWVSSGAIDATERDPGDCYRRYSAEEKIRIVLDG